MTALQLITEGYNYVTSCEEEEGFDEEAFWALCEHLTDLMVGQTSWRVQVKNFGWTKANGEFFVEARTGEELLRKVLPDTECHFKIYHESNDRPLMIQNYHHDSPMGDEWYTLYPLGEE